MSIKTLRTIIIFTRYPEPGFTKTRLIPVLGTAKAALLQKRLTERLVWECEKLRRNSGVNIAIYYTGGSRTLMEDWLGAEFSYYKQSCGDIGNKMRQALAESLSHSCSVVLVGSDIPLLTSDILEKAFETLQNHDIVFGPAKDGGYYLIGCNREIPELFSGITWSNGLVLAKSLEIVHNLGLSCAFLEELDDIDDPKDLLQYGDLV